MTLEQTYIELRELLSKKYKNIDFNVELKNNSICVEGDTIIGRFVVDLPFTYSSFEECVIWYNIYESSCYECNEYMEEWNFENWGVKYWSKTKEFLDYVEKH